MTVSRSQMRDLLTRAQQASRNAYAPYSQYRVGSAVLAANGQTYVGCNVENASYGLTNCAERTALFSAIADGCEPQQFVMLAVAVEKDDAVVPCGACRQVLAELCSPDMPVVMEDGAGKFRVETVAQLLPSAFSRNYM